MVADVKVAIKHFSLGLPQRTRRRLRREMVARHLAGEDVVAYGPVLLRFLRMRREVRRLMKHARGVRPALFDLAVFSTNQSFSLFKFKPDSVVSSSERPFVDEVGLGRPRSSGVGRVCIELWSPLSLTHWVDLEELFRRYRSALCAIFYATLGAILARWACS